MRLITKIGLLSCLLLLSLTAQASCGVTGTDVTFKENLIRAGLNYRF